MAQRKKVLITGAAGYIGTFVRKAWKDRYDLVITDTCDIPDTEGAEVVVGDIKDVGLMRKACEGVDTVVHLAAEANPSADFDTELLPTNIIGTHNVYRAATEAGVRRTVFASSIHAVGAYPADVQVRTDMPVRPCCEYGASKAYGEALGSYFADRKGLSVIAVRIGGVHGHDDENLYHQPDRFDIQVSEEDLTQLLTLCIEAPDSLKFAIVHGISNNRFKRLDISTTRSLLGYEPRDTIGEEMGIKEQKPVHPSI